MRTGMNALIYALYLLRRRTKEEHDDALSNAVFYSSVILLVGLTPVLIWLGKLLGFEFLWAEFAGISGGKWGGVAILAVTWIVLKIKMRGVSESAIYKEIEHYPFAQKRPEVVAFSPLIFAMAIMLLYLLF